MATSKIEWTDITWNPTTGCTKISPGCENCYAERLSKRLKAMGIAKYQNEFELTLHQDSLHLPLTWKTPSFIFVDSMSDLFHENVPLSFITETFKIMEKATWHTFQVLTKRSERLLKINKQLIWPKNVWMGVTVENQEMDYRIDDLRKTNARIKFLSMEPLLGPINNLNLEQIDWVIVGGESGPCARPVSEEWVIDIRDQCTKKEVPFFFKQWGGVNKKKNGKILQGQIWNQMPEVP
jgi:protein gp37